MFQSVFETVLTGFGCSVCEKFVKLGNCLKVGLVGLDYCVKTAYSGFRWVGDDCLLLPYKRPSRHHPYPLYLYRAKHSIKISDKKRSRHLTTSLCGHLCKTETITGFRYYFKPQILYRALYPCGNAGGMPVKTFRL